MAECSGGCSVNMSGWNSCSGDGDEERMDIEVLSQSKIPDVCQKLVRNSVSSVDSDEDFVKDLTNLICLCSRVRRSIVAWSTGRVA